MKKRFGITLWDACLLAAVAAVALVLFALPLLGEPGAWGEILLEDGVQTFPLDRQARYHITSRGYALTVEVDGGKVWVSQSDCREGICRNTPPISRVGQSIVCASAGVVVRIAGEGAVVDGVSG